MLVVREKEDKIMDIGIHSMGRQKRSIGRKFYYDLPKGLWSPDTPSPHCYTPAYIFPSCKIDSALNNTINSDVLFVTVVQFATTVHACNRTNDVADTSPAR